MVVAVLDNGIYRKAISSEMETYIVGNSVDKGFVQEKWNSHATICAKIIEKYSSPDKIIDVVFIGQDGTANTEDMCEALEFCARYKAIDVINLSNGIEFYDKTSDIYRRLVDVCRRLHEQGVRIFAAQSNNGRITLPADLPYTISVEQIDREANILTFPYRRSDIYTKGEHFLRINHSVLRSYKSNSYSCAYASALYCNKERRISYSYLISGDVSFYSYDCISDNGDNTVYSLSVEDIDSRNGILYTGPMSKKDIEKNRLNNTAYLSLVYDRNLAAVINKRMKGFDEEAIPVIYIEDSGDSIDAAIRLDRAFKSELFNSSVLTDNKHYFLNGAIYIPPGILDDYIKYYSFRNGCDLVFAVVEKLPCDEENVCLRINESGYLVYIAGKKKQISDFYSLKKIIEEYYS